MTTYLEYFKTILEKVSFSKELLMKEYQKALTFLQREEQELLIKWMNQNNLTLIPARS